LTLANKVTIARIIFIPLALIMVLNQVNGLAALIFLVLSFSDAIDGYIARKYNQVSDLGKLLDPLADKILIISLLIALVSLGKASVLAVILLTARELIVSGLRTSAAKAGVILPAGPLGKWKTILQVIAIFMLILDLPLANLTLWAAVLLGYISGGEYLWQNQKYLHMK